jgi:hypothetical protein
MEALSRVILTLSTASKGTCQWCCGSARRASPGPSTRLNTPLGGPPLRSYDSRTKPDGNVSLSISISVYPSLSLSLSLFLSLSICLYLLLSLSSCYLSEFLSIAICIRVSVAHLFSLFLVPGTFVCPRTLSPIRTYRCSSTRENTAAPGQRNIKRWRQVR